MTPTVSCAPGWRPVGAALALLLLGACGALKPLLAPATHPKSYALAEGPDAVTTPAPAPMTALTLIVSPPHAAAGFDSQRMVYLRRADELQYFAYNEWIDTPPRMLAPLIVTAVKASGAFRAVVQTPSPATGDMRLDAEILRLQHEFFDSPSKVRLTLRAYIVDVTTRRVVASREFEALAAAPSEDARGGVTAAHAAVRSVLKELAEFCAQTASQSSPRAAPAPLAR